MSAQDDLHRLEHALVVARQRLDELTPPRVSHSAAEDLRAILGATDRLLHRYLASLTDPPSRP